MDLFPRHLAGKGHDVTVVAEVQDHPLGVVFGGYRGRVLDRRREAGYEMAPIHVHASTRKSFWGRISFDASHCVGALPTGRRCRWSTRRSSPRTARRQCGGLGGVPLESRARGDDELVRHQYDPVAAPGPVAPAQLERSGLPARSPLPASRAAWAMVSSSISSSV